MRKILLVSSGFLLVALLGVANASATVLTLSGLSANSKTYDGTNLTTVNLGGAKRF